MLTTEPKEALLIKKIEVSNAGPDCTVRIGDLNGDGRLDFVLIKPDKVVDDRYFPHSVASATAYNTDGEILWQIGKPDYSPIEYDTDLPAQIYDVDRDGFNEFLCVMDGFFCVYDGKTGELKKRHPLPHKDAHDCIAIADLEGSGYPENIILKTRYHQLWAMDKNFNILWTYKGNVGHYPLIYDLNNDGKDEIIAGNVVLSSDGEVLWEFNSADFPTSVCVSDIGLSREPLILCGGEKTTAYMPNGEVKWSLDTTASTKNLVLGNFRSHNFGIEIAGFFTEHPEGEFTDGLFLTDYRGNTLFKERRSDYMQNACLLPVYNFEGEGYDTLLVYGRPDKQTCIYDGYMNPIYTIPSDGKAYVCDVSGSGVSQVVIYNGQNIEIYSSHSIDTSISHNALPRPQPKQLYNSTRFSCYSEDSSRYALGYAIGQFVKSDIKTWAEECALREEELSITKADFCVILTEVLCLSLHSADAFFDISKNDYFYNSVSTLKNYGYIDDVVGKFMPNAPLTAEFAILTTQRAAGFTPLTTKSGDDELYYRDVAKIVLQIYQKMND